MIFARNPSPTFSVSKSDTSAISLSLAELISHPSSSTSPEIQLNNELIFTGLAAYLQTYSFPTLQRKNPTIDFSIAIALNTEFLDYSITIQNRKRKCDEDCKAVAAVTSNEENDERNHWNKIFTSILKKITVDDLGNMDAEELWNSIPEGEQLIHGGRGRQDLLNHEKQLHVKVVFDGRSKHVLLVGTKPKLDKKCITIRNILSHYHWRLSGKDVSMK